MLRGGTLPARKNGSAVEGEKVFGEGNKKHPGLKGFHRGGGKLQRGNAKHARKRETGMVPLEGIYGQIVEGRGRR